MSNEKQLVLVRFGKIVLEIGILLFAVALAWGTLHGQVNRNIKDIESQAIKVATVEENVSEVQGDIKAIRATQQHVLDGIGEIKAKMK